LTYTSWQVCPEGQGAVQSPIPIVKLSGTHPFTITGESEQLTSHVQPITALHDPASAYGEQSGWHMSGYVHPRLPHSALTCSVPHGVITSYGPHGPWPQNWSHGESWATGSLGHAGGSVQLTTQCPAWHVEEHP
jgi:hypothetical protein